MGDFWTELLKSVASFFNVSVEPRKTFFRFQMSFDKDLPSDMVSSPDVLTAMTAANMAVTGQSPQSQPATQPMWVQARTQLAALQKADPNFLEADFLTQASKTYNAVLCAEGAMNPSAIQSTVTPEFFQHFQQRINDWKNQGMTRVVSDVTLDAPATFKVAIGGDSQAITVRFTGTAKRFTRDDMTNVIADGNAQAESLMEFATFKRPAGSTTPKSVATGGQLHCPSCGAPLEDGATTCSFCGAAVSGTGGTWLLDHISVSPYT